VIRAAIRRLWCSACQDRFPEGVCACGADLGAALDVGIVNRYQQHEIPQVSVKVTQYDQHSVRWTAPAFLET
jgi:hypothetical protein